MGAGFDSIFEEFDQLDEAEQLAARASGVDEGDGGAPTDGSGEDAGEDKIAEVEGDVHLFSD